MINLDTLHLTGCRLPKDLTPLTQLDGLSTLSLDETDVSESQLDTLTQFNDLRFLDLSYTQLPASSIPKLAEITTLRDLLLHDMPVDSAAESFANMPRIKQLDLSSSDISDKGLEQLLGCKKLEIVVAVDTQLTDEAIDRFEQQHPIAAVLTEFVDEMEFGEMEE